MDFGLLPPEINSGRMYAGPGSGPMRAAAAAWDELASQLHSTTYSYRSVVSAMATDWRGPSAVAMAAAAESYAAWMSHTAAAAEEAASQATAAAAAYDAAFEATVPPFVIAANRAELMLLVATNFFGQNTPAIMATEAHYAAMWAQDATTMAGYAGSSAASSQLAPFEPPPPITNPTAPVVAATSTSSTTADLIAIDKFITGPLSPTLLYGVGAIPELLGGQGYLLPQALATLLSGPTAAVLPETTSAGAIQAPMLVGVGGFTAVAAQSGRAESVGRLSVPLSWAEPVPSLEPTVSLSAGSEAITPTEQMASAALLADEEAGLLGAPASPALAGRAATTSGNSAAPAAGHVVSTSADAPALAENVSNIFVIREPNGEGID